MFFLEASGLFDCETFMRRYSLFSQVLSRSNLMFRFQELLPSLLRWYTRQTWYSYNVGTKLGEIHNYYEQKEAKSIFLCDVHLSSSNKPYFEWKDRCHRRCICRCLVLSLTAVHASPQSWTNLRLSSPISPPMYATTSQHRPVRPSNE